jgi:enamine deaminase RidA (YjgF/YER057c/UK114 family)
MTAVEVRGLMEPGALVEIEVTAVVPEHDLEARDEHR